MRNSGDTGFRELKYVGFGIKLEGGCLGSEINFGILGEICIMKARFYIFRIFNQ